MRRPICHSLAIAVGVLAVTACDRVAHPEAAAPAPPRSNAVVAAQGVAPQSREASTPAPRDALTDSVITTRIKAGILSDPGMAGSDVSVNTDRGVVSLTGIIKSQEQAAIASAYAQRQDGVMRVDSQLVVNLH